MRPLVLMWENFGPMHLDRLAAVTAHFEVRRVVGLELFGQSEVYRWEAEATACERITLLSAPVYGAWARMRLLGGLIVAARRIGRGDYVLCHPERPEVFLFALWLRLTGSRVLAMGCSKFDDRPRRAGRELAKRVFFLPYRGMLASSTRSRDYARFLGFATDRVAGGYNSLSIARVRRDAGAPPAPEGEVFTQRGFLTVARLVPKKNLGMVLQAYAIYRARVEDPRPLTICGDGPEEAGLRHLAEELGIAGDLRWCGFLQREGVAQELGRALALLLPSREEQFGNVVIEAQAMGLPVILSHVCGAADELVRDGVNGFTVSPDSAEGLAFFMELLHRDEALWRCMAQAAAERAEAGDVARFCEGLDQLLTV
ncbi:MAG: glycosyltransferase family 4 protein [Rhodobacteraceae bacterium]|nr:glycosyltransferase family 4 protein [Paracoccaceae bacterium]